MVSQEYGGRNLDITDVVQLLEVFLNVFNTAESIFVLDGHGDP
jgi:hypothetical protein